MLRLSPWCSVLAPRPPHLRFTVTQPARPSLTMQVIDFCREKGVDFVMVGPEQPLVEGMVDALTAAGITAFGPTAAAAQLEGSKAFMKNICRCSYCPL